MMNNKRQQANKSFGNIISDGFRLFISNYAKIIIPFFIFLSISSILKNTLLYDLQVQVNVLTDELMGIYDDLLGSSDFQVSEAQYDKMMSYIVLNSLLTFLNSLIGLIFTVIAMASVSNYLLKRYNGEETDFWKEFKATFQNKNLISLVLLLAAGLSVGAVLFYIPSIIIYLFYIFSIFTFHNEEQDGQLSRAKSISKVSSAKTRLIGLFILTTIITEIVNSVVFIFSDFLPATSSFGVFILYNWLFDLPSILLGPLLISFLTPLYSHLRSKKEFQYQSRWQSSQ
ncbi:MAG: hypothetical protein ACOC35_17170, partial [Promethearchaeia archaeon]